MKEFTNVLKSVLLDQPIWASDQSLVITPEFYIHVAKTKHTTNYNYTSKANQQLEEEVCS
jgi:hypothetical protein